MQVTKWGSGGMRGVTIAVTQARDDGGWEPADNSGGQEAGQCQIHSEGGQFLTDRMCWGDR